MKAFSQSDSKPVEIRQPLRHWKHPYGCPFSFEHGRNRKSGHPQALQWKTIRCNPAPTCLFGLIETALFQLKNTIQNGLCASANQVRTRNPFRCAGVKRSLRNRRQKGKVLPGCAIRKWNAPGSRMRMNRCRKASFCVVASSFRAFRPDFFFCFRFGRAPRDLVPSSDPPPFREGGPLLH